MTEYDKLVRDILLPNDEQSDPALRDLVSEAIRSAEEGGAELLEVLERRVLLTLEMQRLGGATADDVLSMISGGLALAYARGVVLGLTEADTLHKVLDLRAVLDRFNDDEADMPGG